MSSYLLAFIVCDYSFITAQEKENNVVIRIWARKKAIDDGQGDYALNVTGPVLRFFEKYYNASYPLSKSDQIALPDFNAGAMENWGLITYRETALLYDRKTSSNWNRERVAGVIAHELAHMWFGNLVTLKWWNDLWLNEGFATYVSYLGVDYAEPSWNIKELFLLSSVHKVFTIDALASSHPLSSKEDQIKKPEQISELFNTISYNKGAAVLRMLSEFLSESVFVKGLSTYLNQYAFKNTGYSDLWDHLQKAVNSSQAVKIPRSVNEIMNTWVLQMGYPVVTIDTGTGSVSQKHFLLDPESEVKRPSEYNYQWYVPIRWMKGEATQEQYWLMTKTASHEAMRTSGHAWVLANVNVSGYYRVNYDSVNWERLLAQLESDHKVIPVMNRAQLVDDAFKLARAKIQNITLALRTTKYLSKEREYVPWASAVGNLDYFVLMFDRSELYGPIQAYLKKLVTPFFNHLKTVSSNWSTVPAGHSEQYSQVSVIKLACSTGVQDCTMLTTGWYKTWMQNPAVNPIHPNLRSAVYCDAIANGGAGEWNFGWEMFLNATVAAEADKLRFALACTRQPWLLNRYLEYTLDGTKIRKQDATSTIVHIASNVVGQDLAWNFIRTKWEQILADHGGPAFSFSYLISGVTKRFSTEFDLKQLQNFKEDFHHLGFGSGTLALEQAIENTKTNVRWVLENKEELMKWFTSQSA